jgi:tetratricopeptide (TPR) repeat protein
VRLFAARAAAAHPGFALTADNVELVRRICAGLDGLPLALELAAARAASMPLPDLAAHLHDRFRLLDAAAPGLDRRHRSLRATVAWSHDLLGEQEQALLGGLSVFPAPFALAAAEAVGRSVGVPPEDVAILTAHLVAASALQLEDSAGDGARYRVLETTRQFVDEGLTPAVRRRLREHHARFYADVAGEASSHLFTAGSAPWLAVLHRERAHLRGALEWTFGPDGEAGLGGRLVRSLWHYWDLRGARAEGLRWVHAALGGAAADRSAERLPLLSAAALLHLGRAEFEATATAATEQLDLARLTADRAWEGDALRMLATVAWARGGFDRAQQLYEDAARASLAGGDLWRAAMGEAQLARLHRDRREPDAATVMALRARAHADQVGEELARGLAVDVLASLEHLWGDASDARQLVARALEHYRSVTYREGEASAGALAGRIALAAGDLTAARAEFERSRWLCRRIGHRAGVVAALEGLAEVARAAADVGEACRLGVEAAALRAEIGLATGAISR